MQSETDFNSNNEKSYQILVTVVDHNVMKMMFKDHIIENISYNLQSRL